MIDESWDIGSPQSFAGSTEKIDKDDNEQTGFKESGTGSEKNEDETAEKQQQEMKEVHDFFDLWQQRNILPHLTLIGYNIKINVISWEYSYMNLLVSLLQKVRLHHFLIQLP